MFSPPGCRLPLQRSKLDFWCRRRDRNGCNFHLASFCSLRFQPFLLISLILFPHFFHRPLAPVAVWASSPVPLLGPGRPLVLPLVRPHGRPAARPPGLPQSLWTLKHPLDLWTLKITYTALQIIERPIKEKYNIALVFWLLLCMNNNWTITLDY